jgi:hypothetical protein
MNDERYYFFLIDKHPEARRIRGPAALALLELLKGDLVDGLIGGVPIARLVAELSTPPDGYAPIRIVTTAVPKDGRTPAHNTYHLKSIVLRAGQSGAKTENSNG